MPASVGSGPLISSPPVLGAVSFACPKSSQLPVPSAFLRSRKIEPIQLDPGNLQPLGQKRQQLDPDRGVIERQERLLAEPRRFPRLAGPSSSAIQGNTDSLISPFNTSSRPSIP